VFEDSSLLEGSCASLCRHIIWIKALGGGTEVSSSTRCSFMREPPTRSGPHATRPHFFDCVNRITKGKRKAVYNKRAAGTGSRRGSTRTRTRLRRGDCRRLREERSSCRAETPHSKRVIIIIICRRSVGAQSALTMPRGQDLARSP
jgi:hypothetical protein